MIFIRATVQSNSEDDLLNRVKVSNPHFWEGTSDLLPSLNSIYLTQGDSVLLLASSENDLSDLLILGKILDYQQQDPLPSNQILFTSRKDANWIIGTSTSSELNISSSSGFTCKGFQSDLSVKTPSQTELSLSDSATLKTTQGAELSLTDKASLKSPTSSVTVSSTDVSIKSAGLVEIANSTLSLKSILGELITVLSTLTTTGSPATQTISPATIASLQQVLVKLNLLLK